MYQIPQNLPVPTTEDLAYLAGYFDGEGSVCVTSNGGRSKGPTLRIQLRTGDLPSMELFAKFFGGEPKPQKYRRYKDSFNRKRQIYSWYCTGERARWFLGALLPYLRAKRGIAELALGLPFKQQGQKYSEQEIVQRWALADQITAFNQRVTAAAA